METGSSDAKGVLCTLQHLHMISAPQLHPWSSGYDVSLTREGRQFDPGWVHVSRIGIDRGSILVFAIFRFMLGFA